ncbi:ZYRO0D08580p [Zygosaccharomyces rouxii]|uniref:Ataxin-10 homolog n=2 Tax=Zygosaccharomyces rouxii TaxID=4956 RepID=C5DVQ4_ZYGRC|nr:uncharacterized protein ZYRO0D08580g [Zygosaccharomyces rouxii]KAH9200785.1 copper transport protein 86 [Zygosaccharomyces rouxii]CAQ43584.1 Copper transport protein 86 [Zygosaccharomyces rouxii]CAR27873.1 ZYRO0D08580p [Zygosaccharomyces rouxii]
MALEEVTVICEFEKVLNECPEGFEPYQLLLTQLDPIVRRSSQDEEYRQCLANAEDIWQSLRRVLQNLKGTDNTQDIRSIYLRCLRGLFILMRNLSVSNQMIPQQLRLHKVAVEAFVKAVMNSICHDEMEISLYVAATSFLYNITKTAVGLDKETFESLDPFLKYPLNHLSQSEQILYPYMMFFLNLTYNDEFLYRLLRPKDQTDILYELLMRVTSVQDHNDDQNYWAHLSNKDEIDSLDAILMKIFINIVTSESLGPYLQNARTSDHRKFSRISRISQLIVASRENWDKFQLTGIMSWCFTLMRQTAQETEQYFQQKIDEEDKAEPLHETLNICLDVISHLSANDHVQQYILSYQGLETLISLLRILQQNLIRINFYKGIDGSIKSIKATDSKSDKIDDKQILSRRIDLTTNQIRASNFPGSKSFIIEILASLAHENAMVKDKVRELHGLELVLSNCVIDDNDPFIKERSIICIKFLLKENAANQDFVAQLEAQKSVPDETLADVGYEVKIGTDGKIRLQSKN